MNDLNAWGLEQATAEQRTQKAEQIVDAVLAQVKQPLVDAVVVFFENSLSPTTLMVFEMALLGLVREMGRQLLELVLNACEPGQPDLLPGNLWCGCGGYRRRNQKTANRHVASRFGDIVLHRYGYRSWQTGEGSLFPLEMLLGLNQSTTPALVDWIGRHIAAAGSNQAAVIQLLRRMVHPRTGKRLEWTRVADYYHASERIWTMAEVLFGKGTREAHAWARRMLKSLKKPSGASRVLHSAASHFHRRQRKSRKLSKQQEASYWTAYRYLQSRTQFMRYSDYKSLPIPLGSGVTEAACKTVFTQRLKNSGMRWSHAGAKTILTLRTILLSGSWPATYAASLRHAYPAKMRPYRKNPSCGTKIAA